MEQLSQNFPLKTISDMNDSIQILTKTIEEAAKSLQKTNSNNNLPSHSFKNFRAKR